MGAQSLGRRPTCRPALDAEDRETPAVECPPERVAECPDRCVILEHEDVLEGLGELGQPRSVHAVQPRHVHDLNGRAARLERLRRAQRLVQHHGPVGEEERVGSLAQDRAPPGRHVRGRELDRAR